MNQLKRPAMDMVTEIIEILSIKLGPSDEAKHIKTELEKLDPEYKDNVLKENLYSIDLLETDPDIPLSSECVLFIETVRAIAVKKSPNIAYFRVESW